MLDLVQGLSVDKVQLFSLPQVFYLPVSRIL